MRSNDRRSGRWRPAAGRTRLDPSRAAAGQSPGPKRSVSQLSSGVPESRRADAQTRRTRCVGRERRRVGAEREGDLLRAAETVAARLLDDVARSLDALELALERRRSRSCERRSSATIVSARPVAAEASLTWRGEEDDDPAGEQRPEEDGRPAAGDADDRQGGQIGFAGRAVEPPSGRDGVGSGSSGASSVGVGKNRRSILGEGSCTLSCACQPRSRTGRDSRPVTARLAAVC